MSDITVNSPRVGSGAPGPVGTAMARMTRKRPDRSARPGTGNGGMGNRDRVRGWWRPARPSPSSHDPARGALPGLGRIPSIPLIPSSPHPLARLRPRFWMPALLDARRRLLAFRAHLPTDPTAVAFARLFRLAYSRAWIDFRGIRDADTPNTPLVRRGVRIVVRMGMVRQPSVRHRPGTGHHDDRQHRTASCESERSRARASCVGFAAPETAADAWMGSVESHRARATRRRRMHAGAVAYARAGGHT